MKVKPFYILALCLALWLASCQSVKQISSSNPFPTAPPSPQAGKTTIIGKVTSKTDGKPVSNVAVRLADVYHQGEEGAYVLDGAFSPGDITDEQGDFAIQNVDAKEYVIVVGDVYAKYEVIPDSSGRARVWKTESGNVLDVGDLQVNLKVP